MTTRDEARRGTKELLPDAARPAAAPVAANPSLPERLYAARERKGVDLYRAERDTKIRSRYLAALERAQVLRPDLRVALGAVEVDALALPRRVQALGERGDGLDGCSRSRGVRPHLPGRPPCLVACRHRSRSSSASSPLADPPVGPVPSRRSTARAFEPSNAPM